MPTIEQTMDFRTWQCCRCNHRGNWPQIPGCEGLTTVFLKELRCEHQRCKKCDKLSFPSVNEDLEKGDEEKKKGFLKWFLRSG